MRNESFQSSALAFVGILSAALTVVVSEYNQQRDEHLISVYWWFCWSITAMIMMGSLISFLCSFEHKFFEEFKIVDYAAISLMYTILLMLFFGTPLFTYYSVDY